MAILVTLDGSFAARRLPSPEHIQQRREQEDEHRIDGLEPGRGHLPAEDMPVGVAVGEELHGVALLLVNAPENHVQHAENDQPDNCLPLRGRELGVFGVRLAGAR